jgi:hypothetical protein
MTPIGSQSAKSAVLVLISDTVWFYIMEPMGRQGTPFPFEGPVSPELLIDREAELALLARRAGDRVNVRLVAPRRYGKTSLVLAHAGRLEQTGWRSVHVDLSRVTDLADVARRVAAAYARLDGSWMRAHLGGLLARLGITVGTGGASVSILPRPQTPDTAAAESVLLGLLDLPLRLWERDRAPTLVVLDEFQDLLTARRDLDGLLRSRIQYHGDAAAYVYAGSEPSMMRALFEDRERPLFGQADPLALGPLPLEAALSDLFDRFGAERLDPGDALAPLVTFADGHPQRTMLLAYLLSDRLLDGAAPTPELAAGVVQDAVGRTEPAHQALWQQLSRPERVLLAAVADGRGATSRAVAAEHAIGRGTLDAAARRLADQGHLVRAHRGSRLTDPLLAEWLRAR